MLEGKVGIVFGVANKRSIAWSIADAWHQAGARLALTYQGERLQRNVTELAGRFGSDSPLYPCDVTRDEEIQNVFRCLRRDFGKIHLVLHSVAFAPKEALEGRFVDTTREAFGIAHDVSAYSLVAISRAALPLMTEGGSIATMTYYGSEKVVPHYNVMGVAKALPGGNRSVPRSRSWPPQYPCERDQRRTDEYPGGARHPRIRQHAQAPRRACSLEAERSARRTRQHGPLSGERPVRRGHRRGYLRGLRL